MSTQSPNPDLSNIKGCADVLIHTVRALADALEACRANGGSCSCCGPCSCCCGPSDRKSA